MEDNGWEKNMIYLWIGEVESAAENKQVGIHLFEVYCKMKDFKKKRVTNKFYFYI